MPYLTHSYYRSFNLTSSHFNGQDCYDIWWSKSYMHDVEALHYLIKNIHGHNFKIEIYIEAVLNEQNFVVMDEDLEAMVMKWNNVNLSVLPEFGEGNRATTELMSETLALQIKDLVGDRTITLHVTVWETEEIFARTILNNENLQ